MIYVPKKDERGKRRYGKWAGNPEGFSENLVRCIAEVSVQGTWTFAQCSRHRGFGPEGLFCKQHAKKARKEDCI